MRTFLACSLALLALGFTACSESSHDDEAPTQESRFFPREVVVEPDEATELLGWRPLVPDATYTFDQRDAVLEESWGSAGLRVTYEHDQTGEPVALNQGPQSHVIDLDSLVSPSQHVVNRFDVNLGFAGEGGTAVAVFATGESTEGEPIFAMVIAGEPQTVLAFIETLTLAK